MLRDYLFLFLLTREFNKLIFMFRDQKVVRAPRKTRINNRYSWLHFLIISPDFQFWDLLKINKEPFVLGPAHRSLIKNKTQTAVINIVNFRIFKFIKRRKLTMFITAICILFLIEEIKASNNNDEFLLLFAVLLVLFATFELFFRHSFTPLFFA